MTLLLAPLFLCATLSIGGCGGSGVPEDPQGPLLAFHGDQPAPAAQRVEGKMTMDERGCLRLKYSSADHGSGRPTLIMPRGYTFDAGDEQGPLGVVNSQGEVAFRVRDAVSLRAGDIGGSLGAAGIGGTVAERLEDQCPGSYLYVDEVLDRSV